jgi:hypothetical protein
MKSVITANNRDHWIGEVKRHLRYYLLARDQRERSNSMRRLKEAARKLWHMAEKFEKAGKD